MSPGTAPLPGIESEPARTLDYWTGIPVKAIRKGGIADGRTRVLAHLIDRTRGGSDCTDTNAEIGAAVGLDPGTVNRHLRTLKTQSPPGVDHPYIRIGGGNRGRRITILYRGKLAGSPPVRMRAHARAIHAPIARACARIPGAEILGNKGFAAGPLFERIPERNHVDVIPLEPRKPPACVHEPAREPAPSGPGPGTGDGLDPDLAGLTADQVRERIAAMEARKAAIRARGTRPCDVTELLTLTGRVAEAHALLAAQETPQGPPATPKVESIVPRAAVAPAANPGAPAPAPHVETPDLIRRLASPAGPTVVDQVVRRLCERVDPEFEGLFRRCCADVVAGVLAVGVLIAAFRWAKGAPGRGVKMGPSFAAYIRRHRESAAARRPAAASPPRPHRRE